MFAILFVSKKYWWNLTWVLVFNLFYDLGLKESVLVFFFWKASFLCLLNYFYYKGSQLQQLSPKSFSESINQK